MPLFVARYAKCQYLMIGCIRRQVYTIEQCPIYSIVLYTSDILHYQSFFILNKVFIKCSLVFDYKQEIFYHPAIFRIASISRLCF